MAPAEAWVKPPPSTIPADQPELFVWGGLLDENRATLTRSLGTGPSGQKRVTHTLSVYVMWISDNEQDNAQWFPVLIDSIRAKVRTVNLSQVLVDPTTGETSQLTDFGERIQVEYAVQQAMANQRGYLCVALVKLPCNEWFTG